MKTWITALFLFFLLAFEALGMEPESVRLSVWRRGESIAGEEFVAANEAVVDYLATLRHPTGLLETIRYRCNVKSKTIRPTVNGNIGGTSPSTYVWIRTVYEIKDCKEE